MPTNRKRRSRKIIPSTVSPAIIDFFMTGNMTKNHSSDDECEIFLMCCSDRKLDTAWESCKVEVLAAWIKKHPCSRPYGFWLLDAPEHRRQIGGSGDGWSPGMARDSEGLPKYWQLNWDKNDLPIFESEATFLERHELLTEAEKRYLAKHPELLESERVEFE